MKFGIFSEIQIPKPIDRDDWDPGQEARVINQALDQIEFADKLGFDYLFEVEHHFAHEYSHSSAPEVLLGALARRTQNIRLGTGITHMPPAINHPARVAERIGTLDVLSGGRVEFGTGSGALPGEVSPFGVDPEIKHGMWREATEECLKMMSQTVYPGVQGKYLTFPAREIVPKPVQRPHPPVWMACSRESYVFDAADIGIGALGVSFDTPEATRNRVDGYWQRLKNCNPIGSVVNAAVVSTAHMLCCPTTEEAVAKGQPGADFFGYAISRYTRNPGRDHIHRDFLHDRARGVPSSPVAPDFVAASKSAGLDPAALTIPGMLFGTPELLREYIRQYESTHVDALIFIIQCGDRRHEDIMASIELFAKEVMPEFKERHHEHQSWRENQLQDFKFEVNSSI